MAQRTKKPCRSSKKCPISAEGRPDCEPFRPIYGFESRIPPPEGPNDKETGLKSENPAQTARNPAIEMKRAVSIHFGDSP
ncbi:hypothetical protein BTO30_08685 [Domibacillus antri]|uniref:Uncharacterized protein n=1 Tax=Domibacillus antri TaxID=1714264 RepID=A0A1Q8Q5U4_9BACI|nr:hypothetical protein BTO30_08685 [Domibacillus antri]